MSLAGTSTQPRIWQARLTARPNACSLAPLHACARHLTLRRSLICWCLCSLRTPVSGPAVDVVSPLAAWKVVTAVLKQESPRAHSTHFRTAAWPLISRRNLLTSLPAIRVLPCSTAVWLDVIIYTACAAAAAVVLLDINTLDAYLV